MTPPANWTMDWNSWKAAGRHAASYAAGVVSAAAFMGLISSGDAGTLNEGINSIADGVAQIAKGAGLIAAVLTPIYTSWRSARAASPESQQASVASRPDRVVVAIDPATPRSTADKIAAIPETQAVITNPEVARNTISDKVVAPDAPAALTTKS